MTREQAKRIVLASLRYRMEVVEVGYRYFLAVKQGKLYTVADSIYFTSREEAKVFADDMNHQIDNGELFLT